MLFKYIYIYIYYIKLVTLETTSWGLDLSLAGGTYLPHSFSCRNRGLHFGISRFADDAQNSSLHIKTRTSFRFF